MKPLEDTAEAVESAESAAPPAGAPDADTSAPHIGGPRVLVWLKKGDKAHAVGDLVQAEAAKAEQLVEQGRARQATPDEFAQAVVLHSYVE